ncbi:SMP-30/gluconolactonase/LRE family protein [Massilia scottii]|uniref:SMP-30/gluconolactonase/LRE family protein n=1 Tax=Massilia scottii TaxID=3057166 RepID=UPI002796B3AB|nr:SMP-30/gluconolactonase/LRE family protein [Massilia sp. CCM 9029]MDQ1832578.1 SMP-30/gluconolactonase/LRE family protein [Massilia sp. CCM 9029]
MSADAFTVVHDTPMLVGECPLWHAGEQTLYWVDIGGFTVHALHPASGAHRAWRMASEPAALAIHAGGGLVVATRAGFVHLDTASGMVTDIAAAPYDTATTRFNDGRVDAAGRFWVGTIYEPRDQQAAQMFCLEKGKVSLKWSGGMMNSNGLGFTPDGGAMYHADTAGHRIDRYRFDVASGEAKARETFQLFSADKKAADYGGRPDGAAVDSEGAYWCAMFEGARLLRFAASGELLREVKLPLKCPTMIAFGGDDLRTLYVTSASHGRPEAERENYPLNGQVLSLRVDVAGREENVYQP